MMEYYIYACEEKKPSFTYFEKFVFVDDFMKMYNLGLILTVLLVNTCSARVVPHPGMNLDDPDIFHNVTILISDKGYPAEDHTVQTADGFILSMQRIPHGKNSWYRTGDKRQAVFMQHGLLSSAADWVINFPQQSLGFILADAGYDVWLGNIRGNTYSKRHVKYTPDMREFWNYSFDEMAKYDLPAMIDYVLNTTGQSQLYYVGHSQGTTAAFALLSENPEYNKKIKLFLALAPVATVGHITSPISYIAPFTNDIDFLAELIGWDEFLPSSTFLKILSEIFCETAERFICEDIMFLLFGDDRKQLNVTRIGVYAAHTPAGSSAKSIAHYGQLVNSKKFTKYDYGSRNMDHYNQTTPPEYDVSSITTPVALLWSMNDNLADPVDVDLLQGKLKSMVTSYLVPFPLFNHADFVLALEARKLLYDEIITLLAHY